MLDPFLLAPIGQQNVVVISVTRRVIDTCEGSSRSEASEDESERQPTSISSDSELSHSPQTQGWIVVKNEPPTTIDTLELEIDQVTLRPHRSSALARCVEALALVIRDVAHVTPHNCRAAVRCVRLLARATLQSGKTQEERSNSGSKRRARSESSDDEDTMDHYHMVSIQLLDLMHTLHSRTAQIFKWWKDEADTGQGAEDYDLWEVAWKPLLQGIAEFCTDGRKQVANGAIAYLQRALLAPALAALGGAGWEACFDRVLLPLLHRPPARPDAAARADTVMCKVFLQHLSALSGRASFASLWSRVARVQRALLASSAEPLREAALESLKNMLLVMHSVRIFDDGDGYNDLWYLTWEIVGEFLPDLKDELFPGADDARPPRDVPDRVRSSLPPGPGSVPVGPDTATTLPTPIRSPTDVGTNVPQNMVIKIPHVSDVPTATNPQSLQSSQNQIQRSSAQSPNILVAAVAHSPVGLGRSPPHAPPSASPVAVSGVASNVGPKVVVSPTSVTPVSGMVPIRNSLYDQTGLTSSVLLQPLNEMISTPIGISIQTQPPILCPIPDPEPNENRPNREAIESTQGELYNEYITNPYNEVKELSEREATLYDPKENRHVSVSEPLIQKSYSADVTPMHNKNKTQFGSTDNLRQESSIFNFSNYFGTVTEKNSEVFDTLMSTQEG